MSREIVFVFDHFYPDYSAGGPITSLANLASLIDASASVKILTSAWYYSPRKKLEDVPLNRWTTHRSFTVWYADSSKSILKAIDTLKPGSVCYLNGVFSTNFFLPVLRRTKSRNLDVVVAPRGMLQTGALRHNALKKNIYLFFLKLTGMLKGVRWHATDEEERRDIRRHFGRSLDIDVIPNVPRPPVPTNKIIKKEEGKLKLIYFSLITRKKNLKFILDILSHSSLPGVTLDIVGPIKDADYWSECYPTIEQSNGVITYLGDRNPSEVNDLLSNYHLFVLPTDGENFGHAIMESMSSWRPVMISEHTPWKDISPTQGGFSLPLTTSLWEEKLRETRTWSQNEFDAACVGAMDYFRKKINMSGLRSMYLSLFKVQS